MEPSPHILPGTTRCIVLNELRTGEIGNAIRLSKDFLGNERVVKLFCGVDQHGKPYIDVHLRQGFEQVPIPEYTRRNPDAQEGLLVFGVDLPGYQEDERYLFLRDPNHPERCRIWEQPSCDGAIYDALVQAGHVDIANRLLSEGRARDLGFQPSPEEAYWLYGKLGEAFILETMTGIPIYDELADSPQMKFLEQFVRGPKVEVDSHWKQRWDQAATTSS